MKILVDADACPVKDIIIQVAKKYSINVVMVTDTSHIIEDNYSETVVVDKQNDSADFEIINRLCKGDIVVTQDYGLASLVLGKGAYAINQNGIEYTDKNIDRLLFQRHINKKARNAGARGTYIPKRTKEDNDSFKDKLNKLISRLIA